MALTGRRTILRRARGLLVATLLVAPFCNAVPAAAMPASRTALLPPASSDSTLRDATPGRPVTVVFSVVNATRTAVVQRTSVVLPEGWRVLSGAGELRLAPGERRAQLVQISVPSTAAAGTYAVALRSAPYAGRGVASSDTTYVRVRDVRSLALEAVQVPPLARAGTPYTVEFLLRNLGNRPERLQAIIEERSGFAVQGSWRDATLLPGEARTLSVTATPSDDLPAQMRHRVSVVATARDAGPGGPLVARAASDVLVLSPSGGARAAHRELPATVRFISSSAPAGAGERASSGTIELSGGGLLRERGTSRVDFLVRGPRGGGTGFSDRDEYRFALRSPHLDVIAGDQTFMMSPLMGHSRDRTGVHAAARLGGFHAGGMVYRDRRGFLDDAGYGASIGYARHRIGSLTIGATARTGYDAGQVGSVRTQLTAMPLASVDAELAMSPGADSMASAYRVQLSGSHPRRFSYALTQRQADPRFAGYAPGTLARSGRADLRLLGAFGVRGTAGEDRVASRRSVAGRRGSQHSRYGEADAYVGHTFSAGVRAVAREMIGSTDTLATTEESLRFTGQVRPGPILLRAGFDVGTFRVIGDSTTLPTWRGSLAASFVGRRHSASVFAEHRSGPRWYNRELRDELTMGMMGLLRPAEWVSIRWAVATTRDLRVESRRQVNADATLAVAPRRGHELSLRARTFTSGDFPEVEPSVRLAYSLPIGIPVGRMRDGGRLVGHVYDAESGRGWPNAMVVVGDRLALTDRDGRVEIDGVPEGTQSSWMYCVPEGTQYIQLDLGASGADRVPTVPMPLRITSRAGSVARIEVPVARSVGITGTVRRLGPQSMSTWDGSAQALTDSIPLEGIVVRLTREHDVHTARTDASGRFAVGDLRPGRWTIHIAPDDLPARHYLETPELTFDIAPGQQARAEMHVIPRKRRLVMVDRAEVVADEAAAVRPPKAQDDRVKAPPRARGERLPDWKVLEPALPAGRSLLFLGQSFYIVGETDRSLENIALLTYGTADMWPRLWLANRHQLMDPDAVRGGTILVVPPRGPLTTAEREARDALRRNEEAMP